MIMTYGEILFQNSFSLLEKLGWFIDVNVAIEYLPTNVFIKRIVEIRDIFITNPTPYNAQFQFCNFSTA